MDFGGLTHYGANVVETVFDEPAVYDEENVYPAENDYGDGEYRETQTILADGGDRFGVSSVFFDRQEELLWMGNLGGHVTSYYGPELQKYTSFQVHASEEVRDISTFEGGILCLTQSSLRVQIRRGIPVYTHTSDHLLEMQAMLQWSPTNVLLGGHLPHIIDFDFNTAQETQVLPVGDNGCAILRAHNRFICGGDPSGPVKLMDPRTMRIEHTMETHSGSLSDMDVHGNLLVTCGFSHRPSGLVIDRFLMVSDFRMMRAVSPIPLVVDPMLLRFLPSFSSRLAVVSTLGQMQLVDTATLTEADLCLYQINTASSPMCLNVASSCQFLSIGDSGGEIHLFSSSAANATFNSFSRDTEFADPIEPLPAIAIDDYDTPLPQMQFPQGQRLLSDWPTEFLKHIYRPTPPIDLDILKSMKLQGTIGYAPNPMKTRRNQVPYLFDSSVNTRLKNSEVGRPSTVDGLAIPKRYRWTELKHGIKDDTDFEPYNKTTFCGLSAHLPNNYCNVMLQLLYFLEPVRCLALSHLCPKEFCLSCELGFLFKMMDKMKKTPCQANNFLRAFRTVPEASALGLILNDQSPEGKKRQKLARLIQNWNRFILHQIHAELLESKRRLEGNPNDDSKDWDNEDTLLSQLFGMKQLKINRCLKCNTAITKQTTLLLSNMTYPHKDIKEQSFCSILENSLCPEQTTPAWCDKCNKFRPNLQSKRLEALPHILALNCGMDNLSDKTFWSTQMDLMIEPLKNSGDSSSGSPVKNVSTVKLCRYGQNCSRGNCRFRHPSRDESSPSAHVSQLYSAHPWLPTHIQVNLFSSGNVSIKKLLKTELDSPIEKSDAIQVRRYDLVGVVCHVSESEEKKNLISFIRVGPEHHERSGAAPTTQWYLFNNFCVTHVPEQEVTWFSMEWKVPSVLYWMDRDLPQKFVPSTIINPITVDVFGDDKSIARDRGRKHITFTPLGLPEMPKKDDLVAMDAEFVTLNQEEAELRSDGKFSTVKPSQLSVARITCVRGQGALEGTPFIDDYISTQEQVFDYLTKFSGIKPGDLDANFSSKHLTTLKSSYLKLRFLVDVGVKFVGHGLRNDFRVINIAVPAEQIIDTVLLFHLPHQRMISLRFLAWHFLGINIQSVTHDSIEDARTALQLYFHYLKLEKEGTLADAMQKLYEVGKSMHWKVPDDEEEESVEWEASDDEHLEG